MHALYYIVSENTCRALPPNLVPIKLQFHVILLHQMISKDDATYPTTSTGGKSHWGNLPKPQTFSARKALGKTLKCKFSLCRDYIFLHQKNIHTDLGCTLLAQHNKEEEIFSVTEASKPFKTQQEYIFASPYKMFKSGYVYKP